MFKNTYCKIKCTVRSFSVEVPDASPITFVNLDPHMDYEVHISTRLHGRCIGSFDLKGKTGKKLNLSFDILYSCILQAKSVGIKAK